MIKPGSDLTQGEPVTPNTEPAAVTVHAAERLSGPDGAVQRGDAPISDDEAVALLQAGRDIVVCGPARRANRNKARELMTRAFGGNEAEEPHEGRMALPHFHPPGHTPEGIHAFYEAPPRHAKKKRR
jgi:hypothetical protein